MEVHKCSAPPGYNKESASLSFYPPDACRFQLAKFHCSYNEASLPIIVKVTAVVKHRNINVRCILRSSGTHSSNKDPLTQVPCEDLSIRLPIPHQWVGAFRRTGRFRIRSIHAKRVLKRSSAHDASSLGNAHMEASVGSAKYEAAYRAIVWRLP
uniref:MHD domain-containing protein n=1 Tax=Ciona savignyi TaxID=51511 RepID=H2Z1X4_CIOSA